MQLKTDIAPQDVKKLMDDGKIVLVDVREPQEFASARIHGALLFPLSTFDARALPAADPERPIIFHCGSGKRSATAMAKCREAGVAHTSHMEGGIQGWMRAGLPVVMLDPTTGAVVDRR